jgi:hypothetical protein
MTDRVVVEHRVVVGDATVEVSPVEFLLATLPKGTPVEWSGNTAGFPDGLPESGVGVLLFTWFYDGVIGEVDCGGRRGALRPGPNKSLAVNVLADTRRLNQPGTHGDGM